MRVLVTGGAGFIGSNYVRRALGGGFPGFAPDELIVLDKLTYAGNRANLAPVADDPRLRFAIGDICDAGLVKQEMAGVDLVVHFAAESHVDRSIAGAGEFVMTNVVGTQTLLQGALEAEVGRFVHVSTDEVYGSIEIGSWPEDDPLLPNSPYAASKASSDLFARAFHRTHGLHVSITRCSNNYGPYQHPEKLIPLFVTQLLEGEPVPLYGDGRNVREWVHVEDHCRGIQLVLEAGAPGGIYNIGGGTHRTNVAITEQLLRLCDADRSMVRRVPDRLGHDLRYSVDDTKIRTELGYAPRIPFDQGLADTVAWYADHPEWWKAVKHRTRDQERAWTSSEAVSSPGT